MPMPPNPLVAPDPASTLHNCASALRTLAAVRASEVPDDTEGYGLFLLLRVVADVVQWAGERPAPEEITPTVDPEQQNAPG